MTKTLFLLFIGSLLLFMAVLPGNHSEAEDAFEYSRLIEEGQGAQLFHPHHLLYLPMQQAVFRTAQLLGYAGRSYVVARSVSMFGGALALCFFYCITCRMQLVAGRSVGGWLPWIAAFGLLFSYGFMRYACEVEIYLPAMALVLAAVCAALQARGSRIWFIAGIVFASLAVLMHTINAALALAVIPCFYLLLSGSRKQAVIHVLATLVITGLVYIAVENIWGTSRPPVDTASEGLLRADTVGKAVVGFGQCVLSANFFFAYETVAEKLQSLFPYRIFSEELFAASHLPLWLKAVAPLSFLSALAGMIFAAGFLLFKACRHRAFDRVLFVMLLWLGGTMLPTVLLEPSNPELWILALAPLWILFFWMMATLHLSDRAVRLLLLMVCLLGIHNITAGMGSIKDQESDYNFKKAEWILQQANEDDVIHTAESFVFTFYLNYWGSAKVRNVNSQDWLAGEHTYVFDDVFNPPSAFGVRHPESVERVKTTAAALLPLCRKIHDDQFGGIWIVDTEDSR